MSWLGWKEDSQDLLSVLSMFAGGLVVAAVGGVTGHWIPGLFPLVVGLLCAVLCFYNAHPSRIVGASVGILGGAASLLLAGGLAWLVAGVAASIIVLALLGVHVLFMWFD